MRAIWSGALSFGLVNIPIKLYSATEEHDLQLNMLHKKDLSPIRYAKVCRADGTEIPYEDIVKGYEYSKGDYVVLEEEDFKKADARKTKTIDIISFTKENQVDTVYYEKPYFLEPEKSAQKPYALLLEAIRKSKKVGIARFVIRNREHLAVLKPYGNTIVLNQLRFHNEVRKPDDLNLPKKADIKSKELNMAMALIDQLSETFKPEQYKDTYIAELKEVIKEKAHGKIPRQKGKAPQPTNVANLMNMLKASLEKQKEYSK